MATSLLGRWMRSIAKKRTPPRRSAHWAEAWTPHFEVHEGYRAIRFVGDVPGVRRDDLQICIAGHRLIVSGVQDRYGRFTRYFTLPATTELDGVTGELREGVLTILAPIRHPSRLHRVEILDA
jgi:HSP20 family molecular chaperone IbpA